MKSRGQNLSEIASIITQACQAIKPKPPLTVSQWADAKRIISSESSAEPGRWITARAPYQAGIMDAFSDSNIETVVLMSSAQIGKTEIILNVLGYHIDYDPCSILILQPTLEMAKAFSSERLAPMLRDCKHLSSKMHSTKTRNHHETILHKSFLGGFVAVAGANSPASLAARPIRLLLCDEVDRYPISAGTEGDPVDLARRRTITFWNRKIGLFSTPTVKGASRIELAYELSDKRRYYVPCLGCGFEQVLEFENLIWAKNAPDTAKYQCVKCGRYLDDVDKLKMLQRGKWVPERSTGKTAGFWVNELYSPFVSFASLAQRFLEAKQSSYTLQVFVNTALGETWEEAGERIEENDLSARKEDYKQVPLGVACLTAAVDVQEDRLEVLVVGWGKGEEAWHIEHKVLHGYAAIDDVWQQLDMFLQRRYPHESGAQMHISLCLVDSGYMTKKVYEFTRLRGARRIYAVKGSQTISAPLISRPRYVGKPKCKLFIIGVSSAKDIIFSRLKLTRGAGCIHFNQQCDPEYFRQLTAERAVIKTRNGAVVREYEKIRERNEILDLWVYNLAAVNILNPNYSKILEEILTPKENVVTKSEVSPQQSQLRMRKRGSWVHNW